MRVSTKYDDCGHYNVHRKRQCLKCHAMICDWCYVMNVGKCGHHEVMPEK